jgi:hypothetical protein
VPVIPTVHGSEPNHRVPLLLSASLVTYCNRLSRRPTGAALINYSYQVENFIWHISLFFQFCARKNPGSGGRKHLSHTHITLHTNFPPQITLIHASHHRLSGILHTTIHRHRLLHATGLRDRWLVWCMILS